MAAHNVNTFYSLILLEIGASVGPVALLTETIASKGSNSVRPA